MSIKLINDENLRRIADRIRLKNGSTSKLIFPQDFITAIDSLTTESTSEPTKFDDELNDTANKVNNLIGEDKAFVVLCTTDTLSGVDTVGTRVINNATIPNWKSLSKMMPIDRIVHLGNIITGNERRAESISTIKNIRDGIMSVGKHWRILDGDHDRNNYQGTETSASVTDQSITGTELARMLSKHVDTISGSVDTLYYYEDIDDLNIRLVYLSAVLTDKSGGWFDSSWGYPSAEVTWVQNVALNTDKHVLFFSNMGLLPADSLSGKNIVNGSELKRVIDNHAKNGNYIIGWINGHNNWDRIKLYDCFNAVTICGNGVFNYGVTDDIPNEITDALRWPRSFDDATMDLFDVLVIKPETKMVNIVRFGAGIDRSFEYFKYVEPVVPDEPDNPPIVPDEPDNPPIDPDEPDNPPITPVDGELSVAWVTYTKQYLTSTGNIGPTQYYHICNPIPVTGYSKVRITGYMKYNSSAYNVCFYKSDVLKSVNKVGNPWRTTSSTNVDKTLAIPSGATHVVVCTSAGREDTVKVYGIV